MLVATRRKTSRCQPFVQSFRGSPENKIGADKLEAGPRVAYTLRG